MNLFWPTEQISGKLVSDDDFFCMHSLTASGDTSAIEKLTEWTYFWPKSTRSWNIYIYLLKPSDVTEAISKSLFDLLNKYLAQEYSVLNFLYTFIDYFWFCFSHTEVRIIPNYIISVPRVLDHELYIHASLWCYFSHRVLHIWPNEHISGKKSSRS